MIVRITDHSNRHYGHYGIVYKISENFGRHQILMLKDADGIPCIKPGHAATPDFEEVPDEENRDAFGWPPALCDTVVHNVANDLYQLVEDGRKFRALQELLKDKR